VVNGKSSPAGTREDAIVFLRAELDGKELSCSATLVARNLALTARHCVAYGTPGPFTCNLRGELLDDGSGAGRLGLDLPAEGLEIHTGDGADRRLVAHGSQVISSLTDTVCIDDIAFVVLDRELDLPVLPLRIGRGARIGEKVSLTGYGLDETMGFDTRLDELSRHTRDDLRVDAVGPLEPADVTLTPPRSLAQVGAVGCVGDSGAPLYATETGAVLGVYSLLEGSSCTSTDGLNLFAHVPVYSSLIGDAFDAAGSEPTLEVEHSPLAGDGGASDGGASGQSGAAGAAERPEGDHAAGQAGEDGRAGTPGDAVLPPAKPRTRSQGSTSGCALTPQGRELNALGALAVALAGMLMRRGLRGGRRAG
jgi:hypothetical protein